MKNKSKSVLDVLVSKFDNYYSSIPSARINLNQWLNDDSHTADVNHIRFMTGKTEKDKLKAKLPAVTPSGIFTKRGNAYLLKHSGLICIDIDHKDNQATANYNEVKKLISSVEFVAYCGYSVSKTGYFVLIPIAYPEKHAEHFKELHRIFTESGLSIDNTPDVSRLRGYSYDPDPYVNHEAIVFRNLFKKKTSVPRKKLSGKSPRIITTDQVKNLIHQIEANRVNIAPTYDEYYRTGFAFIREYGTGSEVKNTLARIFAFSPKFDHQQFDAHWEGWVKYHSTKGVKIPIAYFYRLCHEAGLSTNKIENSATYAPYGFNEYTGEKFDQRGYPSDWDDVLITESDVEFDDIVRIETIESELMEEAYPS